MTASVASFLTQAQKSGSELPPALSGALLLAAIRLSEHPAGAAGLPASRRRRGHPRAARGRAADGGRLCRAELRAAAALPHDPRVLVYAAGALGYELVTLTPPRLSGEVGPELTGPLASVIRKAMSERRDRFRSLKEMQLAVERVQAPPTAVEERVILAAVASSTQLPPAQKLAKIELLRASGAPGPEPALQRRRRSRHRGMGWSLRPKWTSRRIRPWRRRLRPATIARDWSRKRRRRGRRRGGRASKSSPSSRRESTSWSSKCGLRRRLPPQLPRRWRGRSSPPRRAPFRRGERALQSPLTAADATLQLRLAETRCSMPDADGSRAARAEAAFRRAAELDPAWAQPKAGLGTLLLRQGRKEEALAQFRAALLVDPACAEAQQGMAQSRPRRSRRDYRIALSAALGALAAAGVLLLLRPAARATPAPQAPRRLARAEPHSSPPPANDLQPSVAPARAPAPNPAPNPDPNPNPAPARAPERAPAPAPAPARAPEPEPGHAPEPAPEHAPAPAPRPSRKSARHIAAESRAAKGDQALRAFDTRSAQSAFESALKLDPTLPSAHRGMGMVYVLLGKNAEASPSTRSTCSSPDAPDKDQIERLLSR